MVILTHVLMILNGYQQTRIYLFSKNYCWLQIDLLVFEIVRITQTCLVTIKLRVGVYDPHIHIHLAISLRGSSLYVRISVYRRPILTNKDGPRTENLKNSQ